MISNAVGSSDVRVTELGLGTAQLGDLTAFDADAIADSIVDMAWSRGIRYFDTAPHYGLGLSESRLGRSLAKYTRDDFTVSSKVGRLIVAGVDGPERRWDFSPAGVQKSIEDSLHRLGLDRLDIVLIHDPQEHLAEAIEFAYPALHVLREAGVVGAIGVGSGNVDALTAFARDTQIDVAMIAGRLTLLEQSASEELVPMCVRNGISIFNAAVFNSGLLSQDWPADSSTYEYAPASPDLLDRARALAEAAGALGLTLPQLALGFAASQPAVSSVVIGAMSAGQVARNVELFEACS